MLLLLTLPFWFSYVYVGVPLQVDNYTQRIKNQSPGLILFSYFQVFSRKQNLWVEANYYITQDHHLPQTFLWFMNMQECQDLIMRNRIEERIFKKL